MVYRVDSSTGIRVLPEARVVVESEVRLMRPSVLLTLRMLLSVFRTYAHWNASPVEIPTLVQLG